MTISAEEYFKKINNRKTVHLPSGVDFVIRKVQARELLGMPKPFSSKEDLKGIDTKKAVEKWKNMDPEKQKAQIDFSNKLIIKALISPELTERQIDDIDGDDYEVLIKQVTEFSFGKIKNVNPTTGVS